ncbi:MAG: hypothetical protein GX300_06680 [Tissierellia bacterium]|nr:hypothetical protein [Tissierellia bacterium]
MFNPNKNIIIDSNHDLFIFDLSIDGKIAYNHFDSNLNLLDTNNLSEDLTLNYSVTIDGNDIIHLVALINSGELHYYKYTDKQWHKNTIAKFNLKSNIYNQFETLIINDKLHLIYNYSNLINSNIWTIQHIVYDSRREEQYNAIRYISKKTPEQFVVDSDSLGNIHLLYINYINNFPQVYHSFYNPYGKVWNPHPKLLSSDNVNNLFPYLFIDSNNNIHCLWVEDLKYKLNLRVMKMNASGKEKFTWKEINLPHIFLSSGYPFIFELNNKLQLIFISKDKIHSLESEDYGNSWIKTTGDIDFKDSLKIYKSRLSPLNYPDKVNLVFFDEGDKGEIYFINHFFSANSFSFIESPEEVEEAQEELTNDYTEYKVSSEPVESVPSYILEFSEKLDNLISNQCSLEESLEKIINNQSKIINKLENLENLLMENTRSFWARIFNKN